MKRSSRHFAHLFYALVLVSNLALADQSAATIDAFSRVSDVSNVAISPSGSRIAYQRIENDSNLILVLDIASGKPVTSLGVEDADVEFIRFVGENTLMLTYDERNHGADFGRWYQRRIRFLDLETGDIDNIGGWTPDGWDMNRVSTLGKVVGISADFTHLFMTMWEGNASLYSLFDYSIDHGAGNVARARGSSDTLEWFVDDDGNPLARIDFDEDDDLYTIFAYRDGEPKVLFQERTANPQIRVVALTPRQDKLVYLAQLPGADQLTYHTMNLADGAQSAPVFAFGNGSVLVDSGRRAIAFRRTGSFTSEYEFAHEEAGRFFETIRNSMPGERIQIVTYTDDFQHVVIRLSRKWGDSYYLLFSKDQPKPVIVAKETTGAPTDDIQIDYNYEFAARDGRTIRARLAYKGDVSELKKKPLIVLSDAAGWVEQYFAARGYVVVQPLSRDSHIRRTFIPEEAIRTAGQMHTDINDAVKTLVDRGIADPERVCVVGFLGGAYEATLAATESPGLYRCVASVNGYYDLQRLAGRVRERVKDDSYRVRYFEAQYGVDAADKDSLRAKSPLHQVSEDFPPTLFVYFKKSDKLLEGQAKEFARMLKSKNREHSVKSFNTDDLTFIERKTRRQLLNELSGFIDEHL